MGMQVAGVTGPSKAPRTKRPLFGYVYSSNGLETILRKAENTAQESQEGHCGEKQRKRPGVSEPER